jgi:hypothetical protein
MLRYQKAGYNMPAFNDATCPKCGTRISWIGIVNRQESMIC